MKQNQFGVITELDFQKTFKEKIGKDTRRLAHLGVCQPTLAYEVVSADPRTSVLLPCHVSIIEVDEKRTEITFLDPHKTFSAFINSKELQCVADHAHDGLRKVFDTVQ